MVYHIPKNEVCSQAASFSFNANSHKSQCFSWRMSVCSCHCQNGTNIKFWNINLCSSSNHVHSLQLLSDNVSKLNIWIRQKLWIYVPISCNTLTYIFRRLLILVVIQLLFWNLRRGASYT